MAAIAKSIQTFTARRITFQSKAAIANVLPRIDSELKRGGHAAAAPLRTSLNRDELEKDVHDKIGEKGFMYFYSFPHDVWFKHFSPTETTPKEHVYLLGNPLIAQTMLRHDVRAGLSVPVRLLVLESDSEGEKGTSVIYDQPSSVIAIDGASLELKKAAEALDEKLEIFVRSVLE